MDFSQTLDPVANNIQGKDDLDSKAIKTYLKVINRFNQQKSVRDNKNRLIKEALKRAQEVNDPTAPQSITSKYLMQASEKIIDRIKPLDYTIHGTGMTPEVEDIVTLGVGTIMERGNYMRVLRDKGGVFQSSTMFGDGFFMIASNKDNKMAPVKYMSLSNSAVYVDPYATVMRGGGDGRSATKAVVIFSYPYSMFCELWPEWEGKVSLGEIPRQENQLDNMTQRSMDQELEIDESEEIEVGYGFDISNKNYTIFAGRSCTILEEYNDDEYPFMLNGNPYIPVPHFMCRPGYEGFYNYGVGDLLYTIGLLRQKLLNMEIKHVEDNILPTEFINIPKGEYGAFFKKIMMAEDMKAQGKRPYVPLEYDPGQGNAGIASQTMITQNVAQEWQMLLDYLDKEAARMGFNLDEIDRGASVTASQIIAEEEGQNAFVKQMMEYNASETQFILDVTIDIIKKVPKNNKSPLNLPVKIKWKGADVDVSDMTIGDLAETLRNGNWFVKVNARSGANSSNVFKQAQLTRGIQAAVGTPAEAKLRKEFLQLNDIDVTDAEMGIGGQPQGMPQPQGGATVPDESLQMPPSQTDRLIVAPNARNNPTSAL